MDRLEAAQFGFTEFASLDLRDHEPVRAVASEQDTVVERIIGEEFAELRDAFDRGAEFAVTHMESPRARVLHRLECQVLEPHLDRRARWSDSERKRLAADENHRLTLPALLTREHARSLGEVRSCKVCWPNVHGTDPRPLRRLKARGLRAHHVGHVLSTEEGDSLGTIASATIQTEAAADGRRRESVEVVTSSHAYEFSPSEHVYIWDLPTDEVAIERKMKLFERLGSGVSRAH